ncbi:MAG: hypothetical protein RLY93_13990 [Sumerlaeia bacterium]
MLLAYTPDLLVRSRIDLAATHYAVETAHVASDEQFAARVAEVGPRLELILIDLDREGTDAVAVIEAAKAAAPQARVVGFCSHVMTDLIRDARRAGADQVLPNSTFMAGIPGLLAVLKDHRRGE